ncbi:preprotein translocase subunit SecA [Lactobacillus taiwanensis]|jgi:preprotein translocase subunit SecA|uniref:preprotein translocase subunit SecA n=1 Tax=Lactobacillus taiwanensis TaxID=508451 RepID=UPI003530388C
MNLRTLVENNKHKIKRLNKKVQEIESKAMYYAGLSNDELRHTTQEFKQRLDNGETLKDIELDAFAAIREADKRVLGLFPYPVQIMGGLVLNEGNLAEMRTGEGKTLTETMPVYLNALSGKGVHVVTVNDYLCERDRFEMGQVFEWMGLSVGLNSPKLSVGEKKEAYACDITYSTNSELAFDYLRDNMTVYKSSMAQRGLNYCIVDEADSILIDEARTPLIIAGEAQSYLSLYKQADKFVKSLENDEFEYDIETKTVSLLPKGAKKATKYFPTKNIYGPDSFVYAHYVDEALKANIAMEKNKDYVVKNDEVLIVDQFTGRIMDGRRYSDGLHQAIEAKENVTIQKASRTEANITYQNFFRMYNKLAGMSGTASTESEEFYDTYHMEVITIPTNRVVARKDLEDVLYPTENAKLKAVVSKIKQVHKTGQPILVGTISVENSEKISSYLENEGIEHTVLNAKNNAREADIIKLAGQKGAITIATNMAGRGTDIKLGPGVKELGGLYVIGTEKHESRRIDNQLRGRAGRQGDPGVSRFYLSLDDELVQRFGADRIQRIKADIVARGQEYEPIKSRLVLRAVLAAQKRIEGNNFDERKNTLRYDDVLREERNKIYAERQKVLNMSDSLESYFIAMFARTINHYVNIYCQTDNKRDYDGLFKFISGVLGMALNEETEKEIETMDRKQIKVFLLDLAKKEYKKKADELYYPEQLLELEKVIILRAVNENWKTNIDNIEQLRQSITLRGYGQYNPLVEYQSSAFDLYKRMLSDIDLNVTRSFMRSKILLPEGE